MVENAQDIDIKIIAKIFLKYICFERNIRDFMLSEELGIIEN